MTEEQRQEWFAKRELELTEAITQLARKVFGVQGRCGCGGAYDDGCPLCTPERREGFESEVRASIERYR